jgi:hypothetical protein
VPSIYYQINLQCGFGGSKVYTAIFAKAAEPLLTFSGDAFILRVQRLIELLNFWLGNLWQPCTSNHSKAQA